MLFILMLPNQPMAPFGLQPSAISCISTQTEQIINTYVNDPNNSRSISNSRIRKVFFKENKMWVGTARGLNLFDPRKNDFTQYLTGLDILNIYNSPDGKLWLTTGSGARDFDPETGRSARFTGPNFTWAIVKDRQDILWLPTLHGLHQINPKRKKIQNVLAVRQECCLRC